MNIKYSQKLIVRTINVLLFGSFTVYSYAEQDVNQDILALPVITVTAEQDETSYTKKKSNTSTKLDLNIKETPQSVTVISQKQIEEMGATDLGQLLLNTTGVLLTGDNSSRTNFSIRGFNVGDGWNSNMMQYDGVAINASNVASSKPDVAMIESIEVIRGSAGLMQGSGEPSGAINIIRKKPTADFQASAAVSYGSWDKYRGEVDVSNRLNDSGTVRGRLVLAYQDSDSYIDAITNQTNLVYGIVSADLTSNTLLNVGYSRQGENAIAVQNLPRGQNGEDLKLDRSTCSCSADDYWDKGNAQGFMDITHNFDNGWLIKGSYTKAKIDMDMIFTSLSRVQAFDNIDGNQAYVNKYAYKYDQRLEVFDLFTKGSFKLFGREHELVLGGNSQESDIPGAWTSFDRVMSDYSLAVSSNTLRGSLIVDPRTYNPYQLPSISARYNMDGGQSFDNKKQYGFYLTTRLDITDPFKIIAGIRNSNFKATSKYKSNVTGQFVPSRATEYEINDIWTPYLGTTFNFTDQITGYASYADTFVPQNVKDASGQLYDPIEGKTYELGLKVGLNDDQFIGTLAAFRVDQVNRTFTIEGTEGQCPLNGTSTGICSSSAGKVISEGIEAELRGEIIPNLNISFGYTYNTTEYANDPVNQGRVFNETTPEHLLRAFASYKFNNKLVIGGGVNYQSDWEVGRYGTTPVTQTAYALVNLMASYPINDHLTIAANANNIFDEKYYSYLSTSSNRYGDPRNFLVSLKAKF